MNQKPSPRSLRSSAGFETFVLDQLSDLGDVTSKKMFGGIGLYCGGVFFGIIARDQLYLKVDDKTRRDFEREGMRPFKPYRERPLTMQYYAVPVGVLESATELPRWAKRAVAVGASGAESKNRPRRRSSSSEGD
jgi:DNA transformation protein